MFPLACQTAGPIGLNFFVDTDGWPGGVLGTKNRIFFQHLKKKIFYSAFFTGNAGRAL